MSRVSTDELAKDGTIRNGFDYDLQVWVVNGQVTACAHPARMRSGGRACCNQARYAGHLVATVHGHEVRS